MRSSRIALLAMTVCIGATSVASAEEWNSYATGIRSGSPMRVSVGYSGTQGSRAAAERAALQQCQKNGVSCTVKGAWNSGCVYVTTGTRGTKVAWGADSTSSAAYNTCRSQGVDCRTPIGGCVSNVEAREPSFGPIRRSNEATKPFAPGIGKNRQPSTGDGPPSVAGPQGGGRRPSGGGCRWGGTWPNCTQQ